MKTVVREWFGYLGRCPSGCGDAMYVTDIPGQVGAWLPARCSCGRRLVLEYVGPWVPDGVGGSWRPPAYLPPRVPMYGSGSSELTMPGWARSVTEYSCVRV